MFDPTQLDQVNDVVQRAGFSDKRKRNEAIRSGMENPGAFQEQNTGYIQEAQQPSEFVGAGRKLAANQNVDPGIASLFKGSLTKHGNEWYSYGDQDLSTAKFGTDGYKTEDIGQGKYNIFSNNNPGSVLGTGYYDPGKAWNQIWDSSHAPTSQVQEQDGEGGLRVDSEGNPIYETIQNYRPQNSGGGALEDWEILGQLLNGSQPTGYGAGNDVSRGGHNRFYTTNNRSETISGLNTLYGSQPLIYNDKLLGYKMNLNPNDAVGDWGYQGADKMGLSRSDRNGKTQSASSIWRELNNPEEWSKHGQRLDGSDFFTTPEEAANLPGWTNKESNKYHQQKSSGGLGGLGKIFSILGPILSFTPLAPLGYAMTAINGINSLNQGNVLGGLASLFGAGMGLASTDFAGMAGVDQAVGGGFSGADLVDFSTPASAFREALSGVPGWALSGGMGGLSSASQGKGFLPGMVGGALGNVISGGLGSMFDKSDIGDALAKATGGAASKGIQSLFNRNQAVHGSEQAGRSGGLNAMLNSTSTTHDQYQQSPEEQMDMKRRAIQLAMARQRGNI